MFIESSGRQMQYVLVEGTPVKVEEEVTLCQLCTELDLSDDRVGVYTDEYGERRVLPLHEEVVGNVPPNREITLEDPAVVEQPEPLFSPENEPQSTEVVVEGDPIVVDEQTTAAELKMMVGAEDREILVFCEQGGLYRIEDDTRVLNHVEPGTEFELRPVDGSRLFGGGIPA